jgi:hypothetical protein
LGESSSPGLARQLLAGTGIWRNPEESGGIQRNPEESGGIRRNPEESSANTGIPVPRKFLQKNPVKTVENRNLQDPSKTTFL